MPRHQYDWTWAVQDAAGNTFTELDVRVFGDWSDGPELAGPTNLDAKALFMKHGKWQEFDIPNDLRTLCIRDLDRDHDLAHEWAMEIAANASQDAADSLGDHIRERREDEA